MYKDILKQRTIDKIGDHNMADEADTNVDTELDQQGKNDVATAGSDTNQDTLKSDAKYTQKDIDNIIRQKQAEWKTKYKLEFDRTLEGKHVLTEDELVKLRKEAVDVAIKGKELEIVKKTIQSEYGLSDAQVARLAGDDEKSLREDAELVFGGLKKKDAPKLNPGTKERETIDTSDDALIAAALKNAVENAGKRR